MCLQHKYGESAVFLCVAYTSMMRVVLYYVYHYILHTYGGSSISLFVSYTNMVRVVFLMCVLPKYAKRTDCGVQCYHRDRRCLRGTQNIDEIREQTCFDTTMP